MTKEETFKTIEDYVRASLRMLDLAPTRNERYEEGAKHIISECRQEAGHIYALCSESNEMPFTDKQQVEFFVRQIVAELAFSGRLKRA